MKRFTLPIVILLIFVLSSCVPNTTSTTRTCCKRCTTGKPCGDSCIARNKTCRVGAGCACSASAYDHFMAYVTGNELASCEDYTSTSESLLF